MNTEFLGFPSATLEARAAIWTAREIAQQPTVWALTAALVKSQQLALQTFLAPLLARDDLRVVLTGAGSSAFIGECLAPMLRRQLRRVDAVATTDIVSGPDHYLRMDQPTLLVSFARSGNSPESVAAIDLAERCVAQCWHLVITCNQAGAINQRAQAMNNALVVTLPDETHDRSFAMTSSFSSMLLSAALIFGLVPDSLDSQLAALYSNGERVLSHSLALTNKLIANDFARVIYLGSKGLQAVARESALKLLELTDGRVTGLHDSSLGFRHGPKTSVNEKTLVVVFCSSDAYTRQYDLDLLRELCRDKKAAAIVAVSAEPIAIDGLTHNLVVADKANRIESDIEMALLSVMFAQVNAFLHSLQHNVTPDNPSPSGLVNRVVQGVTIYPYSSSNT